MIKRLMLCLCFLPLLVLPVMAAVPVAWNLAFNETGCYVVSGDLVNVTCDARVDNYEYDEPGRGFYLKRQNATTSVWMDLCYVDNPPPDCFPWDVHLAATVDRSMAFADGRVPLLVVSDHDGPSGSGGTSVRRCVVFSPLPPPGEPVAIRAVDSVTGSSLSGWTLDYVADSSGAHIVDSVSVAGSSTNVSLPAASNYEYRVHCSKTGYEQSPGLLQFNVPAGGTTVTVSMRPLEPAVNPDSGVVTARIVNSDTSAGLYAASLHVGSYMSFSGSDGVAYVVVPPGEYVWGVVKDGYHPTGGYVTVVANQTADLGTVYTVRKTSSSSPPPTLPPEFPADIPDPADIPVFKASEQWRWTIEQNNSLVAQFASPLLNMLDGLALSADAFVMDAFHLLLGPVVTIVSLVSDGADSLESSLAIMTAYMTPPVAVLKAVLLAVPDKVVALATFALSLNFLSFVLRGPI